MPRNLEATEPNAVRACLGDAFSRLPDTIQRAHSGKIRLIGQARVMRGGRLANIVANVLGLPPAADQVTMTVEGDHRSDLMIWNRQFGESKFHSCFRLEHGQLVESLGSFRLHLRLEAREQRLHYILERVTLFGVRLPRGLAPDLQAWEGERGGRYDFGVEVRLPIIGRLVRYEGLLDLVA